MGHAHDETGQVFRGMVPLRIVFAACGLVAAAGAAFTVTLPRGEATAAEYYGGVILMLVLGVGSGFSTLALTLDHVVVDQRGVHRRNPIWFDRELRWSEIRSVELDTDGFNTHPRVTTWTGKKIRLRGAASLGATPSATAVRAKSAIDAGLTLWSADPDS